MKLVPSAIALLPVLMAVVAAMPSAPAAVLVYNASLQGSSEVPPNASTALGSATLTVDDVALTYSLSGIFSGLSANATAAHIHRAAVGVPGPVIYGLTVTFGLSGTLSGAGNLATQNQPFDSSYTPSEQLSELASGLWYVNIHNNLFPNGEIRGQLAAVPEPAMVTAAAGAALLGFGLWRRLRGSRV